MALTPRAARFSTAMRVLWRPEGTLDWRVGIGLNASRTGVLVETSGAVEAAANVELILPFSWEDPSESFTAADVLCYARVVRIEPLRSNPIAITFAAAIERYVFLATQDGPPRAGGGSDPQVV